MTEVDTIMREGVVSVPTPAPGQKNKPDDQILLGEQQQQQTLSPPPPPQQQQNGMKSSNSELNSDEDQLTAEQQQSHTNTSKTSDESLSPTPETKPSKTTAPTATATAVDGPTSSSTENGDSKEEEVESDKPLPPKSPSPKATTTDGIAEAQSSPVSNAESGTADVAGAATSSSQPADDTAASAPATGNAKSPPQPSPQNDLTDKPPDKDAASASEAALADDDVVDLDTSGSVATDTDEVAPSIAVPTAKQGDTTSSADEKVSPAIATAPATASTVTPMECDDSEATPAVAMGGSNSTTSNTISNNNNDATETPPSETSGDCEEAAAKKTENGGSSKVPAAAWTAAGRLSPQIDTIDSNVVNLDDDSDVEMDVPTPAVPQEHLRKPHEEAAVVQITPVAVKKTNSRSSLSNDSDGAVVIGSDSESELTISPAAKAPAPPKNAAPTAPVRPPPPTMVDDDDDDDDDCVVIEDETTAPPNPHSLHSAAAAASDLSKRKSLAMDGSLDDSQPPSKRQRGGPAPMAASGTASAPMGHSQLTIKDARTLLPQEAFGGGKKGGAIMDPSMYPMNLSAASAGMVVAQGPPKLVPVSSAAANTQAAVAAAAASLPLGAGGLNANANLLPGLTDDMFVLEAPSFIVPYIYEKPPTDVLKDVVRDIEAKYGLSKEDLAEADKPDEFDMMTEQNKEDKDEKDTKKKSRKRRGGNDPDESWSEDSDDDDDDDEDDDSESGVRTKVLIKEASDDLTAFKGAIKPAAAVAQSPAAGGVPVAKPGQENYFESPLGKFFMDIGVGQVQEFVQSDLIRLQKRKMRKSLGKNITEFERAIAALSGNLEASKKKNAPFKFTMKRCEFCNFKSESALAMANHYETPHMNGPLYKCNFCTFEIRNATEIVYHMEAMHNIKARLIKPLPYHQCPNCGFEDNGKAKLARHQPVCAKKFRPELNLAPPNDWEAPAKIPRIKPRHGLVGTATAYQAMAAQAAAHKAALATLQQQQQAAQARNMQAAVLAQQTAAANKIRGRPPQMAKPSQIATIPIAVPRGTNQVRTPMPNNAMLTNNYQVSGGQLIPAGNMSSKKSLAGQPSISITPLPRQNVATPQQHQQQQQSSPSGSTSASTSKMPPAGIKPGQNPNAGGKAQFVICEICDGYIKDLEQLRNHMQWMHKVKIHPKMIYNRPPLNCQKCQFRFFTDQGLERHLLGSHGLVTSSMQEAANKGKDAGRCPVCGRMYQWKLLNHVSRDHHMTLKPAHLSYKCTVCTATFGMYKQFETHVYTAHSTVAKKAIDGKKSNNNTQSGGANSGGSIGSGTPTTSQRLTLTATNDSLLKPLKINDEITIIPQPSSKPRIMNIESHVID